MRTFLFFCGLLLLPLTASAQGTTVIAKADRHLWLESLNTQTGFDKASRAAILVYAQALQDKQLMSDAEMQISFKINSVNRSEVNHWLQKELLLSLTNYQAASQHCSATDWTCVGQIGKVDELLKKVQHLQVPPILHAWYVNLLQFVQAYSGEQLRLAALFPKVSSEIDTFNDNEWNGDRLSDRQFFLTFDDGPTALNGNTDETLAMLAGLEKSAVFFVLGENFQHRLNKTNAATLASLYAEHCVALHGWEHQSHTKWAEWQTSILRTQALLKTTFANATNVLPLFRPPYGQRKADSGAFFQQHGLQIALWNLDSQDWDHRVNADDIVNRMLTLMLIKRHGVLLFHDIHPKAKSALPLLIEALGDAIVWGDCHQLVQ
jgi:peptidoglycan/xylan/chitin deacetylase (PgdA/CDA1 family)